MKPHIFSQMVNEVRDLAHQYGQMEQFRCRVADLLGKYIPVSHGPANPYIEDRIRDGLQQLPESHVHQLAQECVRRGDELEAARKRVAEIEAGRVVVPELTDEDYRNAGTQRAADDLYLRVGYNLAISRIRAIPSDRVLGEGQVAVDREELAMLRRVNAAVELENPAFQGFAWRVKTNWCEVREARMKFAALRAQVRKDGEA